MMSFKSGLGLAIATLSLWACSTPPIPPVTPAAVPATIQIPVGAGPGGLAPTFNFIYVANEGGNTVSVIDAKTDTVVKDLELPNGTPGTIKPFRAGRFLMVADVRQGHLIVIDSFKDHQIVQTVPLGGTPQDFAIGQDDRSVLVSLANQPHVVVLTFQADRALPPARKDIAVGQAATRLEIAYDGTWAVVANVQEQRVSLIEMATGQVRPLLEGTPAGPVALGQELVGDALTSLRVLVSQPAAGTLKLFPPAGGEATTVALPGTAPGAIAVDEEKARAYLAMTGSNELAVIDLKASTLVGKVTLPQPPTRLAIAPNLPTSPYRLLHGGAGFREVWVGYENSPTMTVVEGETLQAVSTLAAGEGRHHVVFWGGKAYVSNRASNTVSVVDRRTLLH